MKTRKLAVLLTLAILVIAAPAMAGFLSAPGYVSGETSAIPASGYVASFDRYGSDFVYLTGRNVYRVDSTGAVQGDPVYTYNTTEYPGSFYGSFVKVLGDTAYVGESSTSTIRAISLTGSSNALFTTISSNYDMAIDPQGRKFVVSSADWENCDIWYVNEAGGLKHVARVQGASGPIHFDQAGNLYCGAYTYARGAGIIYKWSASDVASAMTDGAEPLGASDAAGSVTGINNPTAFTVDASGNLYYTSFESSPATIFKVSASDGNVGAFATTNITGASFTGLRYDAQTGSFYTIGSWTETIQVWDDQTGGYINQNVQVTKIGSLTPAVPEPSALLGLGSMLGLAFTFRRRSR